MAFYSLRLTHWKKNRVYVASATVHLTQNKILVLKIRFHTEDEILMAESSKPSTYNQCDSTPYKSLIKLKSPIQSDSKKLLSRAIETMLNIYL